MQRSRPRVSASLHRLDLMLICLSRITSVLVCRLILNLKMAASQNRLIDGDVTSYLNHQSPLEAYVIGNMANKPEDLNSLESYDPSGRQDEIVELQLKPSSRDLF